MDKTEEDALREEWARAQGLGTRLARQRFIATAAGMAPVAIGFGLALLLWWFLPLRRIPIWLLALPIAISLPLGWRVRNKLWPAGQFS